MNKAFTLLVLIFKSAAVTAQLNTFESGQTIRADKMNENFDFLQQELENRTQQISCLVTDIVGSWIYVTDSDNDYEVGEITFGAEGSLSLVVQTIEDGTNSFDGSYEIKNECRVEGELRVGDGIWEVYSFPADDGGTMPVLVHKVNDGGYGSATLHRRNRPSVLSD